MSETFLCELCGEELPETQQCFFDGEALCPDCLEERSVVCRECGTRIPRSDSAGNDTPLCQDCYDDYYTHCCICGRLLRETQTYYDEGDEFDESPYCRSCYERRPQTDPIHDYYYKPAPIFYGDGPRFFGVELELDNGGEDRDNARSLLEIANHRGDFCYIKHDGSLNEGMELVTHPLDLAHQLRDMPWGRICHEAVSMGYRSHQARTCGLHVHISRLAFGDCEDEQDAVIARILYFFEKHWEELLKFSRRTQEQLDRWAARYGYKEHPMELLDFAKKGYHGGRYTCINLQNSDTVEFRMFRGTLKPNTIFATLELLDHICDTALILSDDEVKALAWTSFVAGISDDKYPELVQYLKERQLYVNDPVETEVEC